MLDDKTIVLCTKDDYDYTTDEVSEREIVKFITEELNKDNYFTLDVLDTLIYLRWRTDNKVFATIYKEKVIEVIKYIKEEKRNGRF